MKLIGQFLVLSTCSAFQSLPLSILSPSDLSVSNFRASLKISATKLYNAASDDDDEEEIEPGKMRVSEIKAELDLRGIDYSGCFDKESLSECLKTARADGKANPEILDKFNKAKLEEAFNEDKLEINDEDIQKAVANDGTLPGGMEPEIFKSLTANPDVMALLQNPKMQEAIKIMMTEGQEGLEKAMASDPELRAIAEKLNGLNSFM